MSERTYPEFIRLPKPKTHCAWTGMSRSGLYNLTVPCTANQFRPKVPAKCIRSPGTVRGVWLIPFEKLMSYINNLPTPGMAQDDGQGDA